MVNKCVATFSHGGDRTFSRHDTFDSEKKEDMMDLNRKKWCLDTLKNLHVHRLDNQLILNTFLYPLFPILHVKP